MSAGHKVPVSLDALCRAEREMLASAATTAYAWEREALTEAAKGLQDAIAAWSAAKGASA